MTEPLFSDTDNIYLLSHSIGRMPASTTRAIEQGFVEPWASNREDIWNHWLNNIESFKTEIAKLFNAQANQFCPQANISGGLTKLIAALPPAQANKNVILMCENDFPSAGFVLQHAAANGYKLKILPRDTNILDLDTWQQALTREVHSVFITHVHYNNGNKAPVREIAKLAQERDIFSIVDVAQSAGVVPIDFQNWNCDAVVGSCIKWLCGGPGAGWLWVNPRLIDKLLPKDVGWFSHANPFEFDINNFEYAQDSSRFWGGTPNVTPYIIAANSIKLLSNLGIENVRTHNQKLINLIIHAVDPESVVSPRQESVRGGTLVINPEYQSVVEENLREAQVEFDARKLGIRLSPHIYNTEQQIETVVQCFSSVS